MDEQCLSKKSVFICVHLWLQLHFKVKTSSGAALEPQLMPCCVSLLCEQLTGKTAKNPQKGGDWSSSASLPKSKSGAQPSAMTIAASSAMAAWAERAGRGHEGDGAGSPA